MTNLWELYKCLIYYLRSIDDEDYDALNESRKMSLGELNYRDLQSCEQWRFQRVDAAFFLGILIYCIRNSFFAPKPSGIKSDCYTLIRNYVGSRKEPSDSSKGKIINQDKKIANLDFFTLIKRILVI